MHVELEQLYRKDEENWIKHLNMVKTQAETLSEKFAELMLKQQLELQNLLNPNFAMRNQSKYKLKKLPMWGADRGHAIDFEWPTDK